MTFRFLMSGLLAGLLFLGLAISGQAQQVRVSESHPYRVVDVVDGLGRIRDIRQGPDGLIYIAIDAADSKIVRLEPAGN